MGDVAVHDDTEEVDDDCCYRQHHYACPRRTATTTATTLETMRIALGLARAHAAPETETEFDL
jgi:hypothetical protein